MSTLTNVAFPAYTIFHMTLGYSMILIGLGAIISRVLVACSKENDERDRSRRIHRVSGRAWLMATYLMPVTAIWIKPWDVTWDFVAFFIFSMYITKIAGYSLIQIRRVIQSVRIRFVIQCLHGLCFPSC